MALRVDSSSSKVVFGIAAIAVVGVGTALFLRSRGNASAAPAAPALNKDRFAFLANLPLVGRVYTHFNPIQKAALVNCSVGSPSAPIRTMDQLRAAFSQELQRLAMPAPLSAAPNYPEIACLIIYGNHLEITQDPGILVLNPMKLILVSAGIATNSSGGSLYHQLHSHGLYGNQAQSVEVASIEEALAAKPVINPATAKPFHMVYSVRV